MKFKLIMAMVHNARTDDITHAARTNGATGCTVITNARGEGLKPATTFLGLTLEGQCDIVLLLVEAHLSRHILEAIGRAGKFDGLGQQRLGADDLHALSATTGGSLDEQREADLFRSLSEARRVVLLAGGRRE